MASTASTVLRLEIMTPGEQDGTWGQKNNENFQIMEAALTGVTAISTTGGDTALTNVDYVNDQAKKLVLDITGTLVSNATIIIPNASKSYKVLNRTTGAFTVTVKTSAGTGLVITQSTGAEIYCNGSNVVRFLTPLTDFTTGAPATSSGAAASAVSVSATGNLSSTNVQAGLAELQGDIDTINAALPGYQPLDADLTTIGGLAKTKGNIIVGDGSAWAAQSIGTNGYALIAKSGATNGVQWSALIPAGTVSVFYQAAAPTGWTVSNADSDCAMRIVTGSSGHGGSTTGTGATAMTTSLVGRTITTAALPASGLSFSATTSSNGATSTTIFYNKAPVGGATGDRLNALQGTDNGEGSYTFTSANNHTHTVSGTTGNMGSGGTFLDVKLVNFIKATKDAF